MKEQHKNIQFGSTIIFNFPLEIIFRSTNPFWCYYFHFIIKLFKGTQIIVSVYGLNTFDNDVLIEVM